MSTMRFLLKCKKVTKIEFKNTYSTSVQVFMKFFKNNLYDFDLKKNCVNKYKVYKKAKLPTERYS